MRSSSSGLGVAVGSSSLPPSSSSSSVSAVHAVSLDWHQSPEGQGILAHLIDQKTGARKQYGILERPLLPPTVQIVQFKLFLSGKAGVGKTSLVSYLSGGQTNWVSHQGETPGLRVTHVYWPTKVLTGQLILFHLTLWDAGETAGKKYSHIQPVCRENADGGIFVFSFSDRNGFEDLDTHLTKVTQSLSNVCPIVVGNRYGSVSETEVTHQDLTSFESRWNRPVLKVRYQPSSQQQQRHQQFQQHSQANPNEIAFVLNLICDQLWCHRQQQQQSRLQQQPPSSSSAAPPSLPLQSAEI